MSGTPTGTTFRTRRHYMEIDKLIVQKNLSAHYSQSLCFLRSSTSYGRDERWSKRSLDEENWMVLTEQLSQGIEAYRWNTKQIRVENLHKIHVETSSKRLKKMMESILCEPEHFTDRIIYKFLFDQIVWGDNDNTEEECHQNSVEVLKHARRFLRGHWSSQGLGLKDTCYKTRSHKPNKDWHKTTAIMILQMITWLEVYPIRGQWEKHWDASSHCDFCKSTPPPRNFDSEILNLEEHSPKSQLQSRMRRLRNTPRRRILVMRRWYREYMYCLTWRKKNKVGYWDIHNVRQNQQFEGWKIRCFMTIERPGLTVLQRVIVKSIGSVLIFKFPKTDSIMANELELVKLTSSEEWLWFRFPGRNVRKSTWVVENTAINTAHTAQYSLFTSAERKSRARLKNCITSLCVWKETVIWSAHVSSLLFSRLPCSSSTSSSSLTLLLPRHQNMHCSPDNTIYSKNIQ